MPTENPLIQIKTNAQELIARPEGEISASRRLLGIARTIGLDMMRLQPLELSFFMIGFHNNAAIELGILPGTPPQITETLRDEMFSFNDTTRVRRAQVAAKNIPDESITAAMEIGGQTANRLFAPRHNPITDGFINLSGAHIRDLGKKVPLLERIVLDEQATKFIAEIMGEEPPAQSGKASAEPPQYAQLTGPIPAWLQRRDGPLGSEANEPTTQPRSSWKQSPFVQRIIRFFDETREAFRNFPPLPPQF
ncbi:MAG: hypothetical protein ACREGI_04850 [Candidatus Levyibacteriota bacterium]